MKTVKSTSDKPAMKRYLRKNKSLYEMVSKIRLWPSRRGILHGVQSVEVRGEMMVITTFCGESFTVNNSKSSRSARWLRNHWCTCPCPKCKVPDWKLSKYSSTIFR